MRQNQRTWNSVLFLLVSAIDEEDETEYEVERLTLDELAERINDECFNDTEDYVRFIQITD